MTPHITSHRKGWCSGFHPITTAGEKEFDTGINFSILKLNAGESYSSTTEQEVAVLHLSGDLKLHMAHQVINNKRENPFDSPPFAVHMPQNTHFDLHAVQDCELAIFSTPNTKGFAPVIYYPEDTANEHRGKGLVDEACLRWVRTIFDNSNSDPNTELVLGEVVNMPGRWSSYPPHHHPQPEIYHYRFSDPRGYGHAELGEQIFKVKHNDTIKIVDGVDHAQCSAPGYAMYYIWVIRHLPNKRYTIPEFTEDHTWTLNKDATFWQAKEEVFI
jgi:5-deoxy-glucuronate isomerase